MNCERAFGAKRAIPRISLRGSLPLKAHLAEFDSSRKATETYKTFVKTVSLLTESQDPYTAKHQKKVAKLAQGIAKEMGLPADMIEGIRVAGWSMIRGRCLYDRNRDKARGSDSLRVLDHKRAPSKRL